MKRVLNLGFVVALLISLGCGAASKVDEDPYVWLEEVEGEEALAWVEDRNKQTLAVLKAHPEFENIRARSLEILNSDDRIPWVGFQGKYLYNFWRDAEHKRGLWRRTTLTEYVKPKPKWEDVLDLDALAEAEGENWVWKGASGLYPDYDRFMVRLSRGGADAVVIREFDAVKKAFVENGFALPEAKGSVSWIDENTLFVQTNFGDSSLTTSGYPRMAKRWERGTGLLNAPIVFEGEATDVSAGAYTIHTPEGKYEFAYRSPSFFERHYFAVRDGRNVPLDLPADAQLTGIFKGMLLVELKSEWQVGGNTFPQGALLSIDYDSFLNGSRGFYKIVAPAERSAIASVGTTENHVIVNMMKNVRGELHRFTFTDGEWRQVKLAAPEYGTVSLGSRSQQGDTFFFTYTSFLTPSSMFLASAGGNSVKKIKNVPGTFDSDGFETEQHEVQSADGTQIPYFVVKPRDMKLDGSNPTLLYAYGGFEIAMRPGYLSAIGPAWLERGGVYVLANIRGGGEFGPKWHQSALKENRQRAYDDFLAVANDLVERKITSPEHLGISGGSNGGLLVGAAFTQRPELFGAVVCSVPLLDMKRYNKLLAGASWMGEYGNPDLPEEWAFIQKYSPYHNVHPDRTYPKVFFNTSTRDDRVHPAHARKMVAKMEEQGHDVYYYENTEGGHAAASNNDQRAFRTALVYSYLWSQLN